jgi:membrane protease YdiL (CAAX protease family)
VLKILLTGVLVGLIEEFFFRGALFSALSRVNNLWVTVSLTSLLYAVLHFINSHYQIPPDRLNWFSGLVILSNSFDQYANPLKIIDSLLALFFVGFFLGLVRASSGTIAFCIGLHAGWVLTIKLVKKISNTNPDAPLGFLSGHYDGVIGYLTFAWLAALSWIYYYLFFSKPKQDR